MDQINSLWRTPRELLQATKQAMTGKVDIINQIERLEKQGLMSKTEPTLEGLHKAVVENKKLMLSEHKWFAGWIEKLVTVLQAERLELDVAAAGAVS